jgi:hypothetical protein
VEEALNVLGFHRLRHLDRQGQGSDDSASLHKSIIRDPTLFDSNSNARDSTSSHSRFKDARFKGSLIDDILTVGQYGGGIVRAESPTQKRAVSPTHKPWRALDFVHDSLNPAYLNASNSAPHFQRSPDSPEATEASPCRLILASRYEFHGEAPKNHSIAF